MSEIIKTEAVVLSKMNYGDTSLIVSLFTKELGKISAIVKGGRNPKSKIALKVDPLNLLEVVFYNKLNRDLQIVSSADIISHYPAIKSELEKLKYGQSVLEIVKYLTVEHEQNLRLFNGIVRIFSLLEESKGGQNLVFARFFLFFITELGYQIQFQKCVSCGTGGFGGKSIFYNFDQGMLCNNCSKNFIESFEIYPELLDCLIGLRTNKILDNVSKKTVDNAIAFMEKFLKYHISDFKGIKSLQLL